MVILVTGGAGFIGSNYIRNHLLHELGDTVINVDVLTYAGVKENLADAEKKYPERYFFEKADICDYDTIDKIVKKYKVNTIINFAAESHNSYAINNPTAFFKTNIMGTQNLLEITRLNKLDRFHHISTCEVFGDMELDSPDKFAEESKLSPNTPYNASKAGANLAVSAYYKTYDIPVTLTNCSNNYGPYQFPEKLIPLFITNLMLDKPVTLYKESENKREWLHVDDHCRAIELVLKKGKIGQHYNIGSGVEKSVEDITAILLEKFNKPAEKYKVYIPSRPSHDKRYLLDSTKIKNELGWKPEIEFEQGINQTVQWYQENKEWWEKLLDRRPVFETKW